MGAGGGTHTEPRWAPLGSVVGPGDPHGTANLQAWRWFTAGNIRERFYPCPSSHLYKRLGGLSILSGQDGAQPICTDALKGACDRRGMLGWMQVRTRHKRRRGQTHSFSLPKENLWVRQGFSTSGPQEGDPLAWGGEPQRANTGDAQGRW